MNAYLYSASVTRSQLRPANLGRGQSPSQMRAWTTCISSVLCADTPEQAQKQFEAGLCAQPEGESPIDTQINRILAVPFLDQLLTETAPVPIDWPQIAKQVQSDLESIPADDSEQGYWLDVNTVRRPSSSLEALRQNLPEDIRSGLNWAEDKQFFFLLSVLSPPPPPPPDPADEPEPAAPDPSRSLPEPAAESALQPPAPEADFPELMRKEVAVLIRARNAAVAIWLWRKHAAKTKLAGNQIRLDPCCAVVGPATG
jgi:hypothetical protein